MSSLQYTDSNFPSYDFLYQNNTPYLDKRIYDIVRATYINQEVPEQGEIPKAFSHLSWAEYYIVRAISYES